MTFISKFEKVFQQDDLQNQKQKNNEFCDKMLGNLKKQMKLEYQEILNTKIY